jgi:hypothetical protein
MQVSESSKYMLLALEDGQGHMRTTASFHLIAVSWHFMLSSLRHCTNSGTENEHIRVLETGQDTFTFALK